MLTAAITSERSQHSLLQPGAESGSFKKSHLWSPANWQILLQHLALSCVLSHPHLVPSQRQHDEHCCARSHSHPQKNLSALFFSACSWCQGEKKRKRDRPFPTCGVEKNGRQICVYIRMRACHLCCHTGLFLSSGMAGSFSRRAGNGNGRKSEQKPPILCLLLRDFRELGTCLPVVTWHSGPGLMQPRHPK